MPIGNAEPSAAKNIHEVVSGTPLSRPDAGLLRHAFIKRYSMPAMTVDTHVLNQHCVSAWIGPQVVEYGGRLNGRQYSSLMQADTAWFRAIGDSGTCWWKQPMDGIFLSFENSLVKLLFAGDLVSERTEFISTLESRLDPTINHLLAALHADTMLGQQYGAMRSEALLSAIVTCLVSGYTVLSSSASTLGDAPLVRRACMYIAEHLSDPLRVETIAAAAGSSVSHLHRCFRSALGTSLWSYVLHAKVNASRVLMRTSRAALLEISLRVGFESYSQFIAAFRRECGMNPGAYRKELFPKSDLRTILPNVSPDPPDSR